MIYAKNFLTNHKKATSGIVLIALLGLICGGAFARNNTFLGNLFPFLRGATTLTIVARADNTFDIKEFAKANQWFYPDSVGEALRVTASRRFGDTVKMESVNVLVQADPGVNDEAVRIALLSIRQNGFQRIGFTDPRLRRIAEQVAQTPEPDLQAHR